MEITLSLREIMNSGHWDRFCEVKGVNPWCLAEGADDEAMYELTSEECREIGITI